MGRKMHTAEDRRKAVMLRIDRAFPIESCCGKLDAFNPESILSADLYLVKIRAPWQAFRWFPSWLSMPGECNHSSPGQFGKLGTAGLLWSDVRHSVFYMRVLCSRCSRLEIL